MSQDNSADKELKDELSDPQGSQPNTDTPTEEERLSALIDDIASVTSEPTPAPQAEPEPEGEADPKDEADETPKDEEPSEADIEQEVLTADDEEEDEPEEENLDALKARLSRTRKERNRARKTAKRLKDKATYAERLQDLLEKGGIKEEQFDAFIAKGAAVGFDFDKLAPAPVETPAEAPATPAPGPETLDQDLQEMVDSYEIHLDAALKLQRKRAEKAPAAAPSAPPAEPTPTTPEATADLPRLVATDEEKGQADIDAINAKYQRKLGVKGWDKLVPIVEEKMKQYPGLHPSKWGEVTDKLAKEAIAEQKAESKTPAPSAPTPIRAQSRTHAESQRSADDVPKTEQDLAKSIAEVLRGG